MGRALHWAVATVLLVGCGGPQPTGGLSGAIPQGRSFTTPTAANGSWMRPEAMREDLLYVTNLHDVSVYSYPGAKLVGKLAIGGDAGACSNASGDVYLASYRQLYEFRHGDRKPIAAIDHAGRPILACGVDPTTENVAVVTTTPSGSKSWIEIYDRNLRGSPIRYSGGRLALGFCNYDKAGDLFVTALTSPQSGSPVLLEMRKGAAKFQSISLNHVLASIGQVQWDGKYLAVSDGSPNIYRFAISGRKGTLEGTVVLKNNVHTGQWWIAGGMVVAPNEYLSGYYWTYNVLFYKYPAGGTATKTVTKALELPWGATVSSAP